jgi:hypothetical protein
MRGHNRTHIPRLKDPIFCEEGRRVSLRLLSKTAIVNRQRHHLPSACVDFFGISFTTAPAPLRRRRPNDMMTEDDADDLPKGRRSSSFARRRRQSIIKLSQQTTPPQQSSSHNKVVVKLRQLSLQSSSTKQSEAQILIAAEQSFNSSLKAAFAILFVAIAIDLTRYIQDYNIYSKLFDNSNNESARLSWIDYVELFDSTTPLITGLAITGDDGMKMDITAHLFTVTFWAYLIMAVDTSFVSLSIATTLPTIGMDGPFHSMLNGASQSKLFMLVATIIIIGFTIIRSYCNTTVMTEDKCDNERINQEQIDSKNKHHFKRIRDTGKWAYLSMKLAAGSSALYACMDFTKWLVTNKGTIVRGLSLLDAVEPFAQSILLMKMSNAFLRLVIVHRDWTTKTHAKDSQVVCDWFYAQTSFFDKVTDVMIGL